MPPIRCIVSNLAWTVGRAQLRDYFSRFGPLTEVYVKYNKETGLSEKFGFVTFQDLQSYRRAVQGSNEHFLEGTVMRIKSTKADENVTL